MIDCFAPKKQEMGPLEICQVNLKGCDFFLTAVFGLLLRPVFTVLTLFRCFPISALAPDGSWAGSGLFGAGLLAVLNIFAGRPNQCLRFQRAGTEKEGQRGHRTTPTKQAQAGPIL